MKANETPDPLIQRALREFAQDQSLDYGSFNTMPTPLPESLQAADPSEIDAYAIFRKRWDGLSWEQVHALLFERQFPDLTTPEPSDTYALFSFGDLSCGEKVALLEEMVARRRSMEVYWPLVGQLFVELSDEGHPDLDLDSVLPLILAGFRLLPRELQNIIRKQHLTPRIWSLPNSREEDEWRRRAILEMSDGVLESSEAANAEITHWLGMEPLEPMQVRFDFRRQVPPVSSLPGHLSDQFGTCNPVASGPSMTLLLENIREAAARTGTMNQVAAWQQLVMVHKQAILVFLAALDRSRKRNPTPCGAWIGQVADYITYCWAQVHGLLTLFDDFISTLPWRLPLGSLRDCSIETFRFYLWLARHPEHPDALRLAAPIREVFPQLPEIPLTANSQPGYQSPPATL